MNAYLAEFVGTLILVLLGDGVVANVLLAKSKGHNSGWIVIATGWGLAVAIAVYAVGRFSGAHINPAVTVGLASIGAFSWVHVPGYILAQMCGGFVGAFLVYAVYFPHWKETQDKDMKRSVFCTTPAIRNKNANIICEFIGTAVLLFAVLAISANAQELTNVNDLDLSKVFSTGIAPLLIGLIVFAIGLSLGGPTGYAINPARDLAPRFAYSVLPIKGKGSADWSYSWIPVVGPLLGGVVGALLFKLMTL